ncbi:MAG: type II toxin-antitoxin system VapC family toxin [Bacteroidetes bacterium]|nr:type II toxin-antitoxin system VapC family toxin [Bacteroidota bacterium]
MIDTHTLLWFLEDSKKLSSKAKNLIEHSREGNISISIASFWEIAIKLSIGKLKTNISLKSLIKKTIEEKIDILHITPESLVEVENLPFYHKDPFDRMIIATAITIQVLIISKDEKFDKYEIERIW